MKKFFLAGIFFLLPCTAYALPESSENLKKLEKGFILPCDEIGNENCISRLIGVNACTFIFGINKGKNYKDAILRPSALKALNNPRRSLCLHCMTK